MVKNKTIDIAGSGQSMGINRPLLVADRGSRHLPIIANVMTLTTFIRQ